MIDKSDTLTHINDKNIHDHQKQSIIINMDLHSIKDVEKLKSNEEVIIKIENADPNASLSNKKVIREGADDITFENENELDINKNVKNSHKSHNTKINIVMRMNESHKDEKRYQQQGGGGWTQGNNPSGYDEADQLMYDPRTRNSFVKFVLAIVWIMLMVTSTFIILVIFTPEMRRFFRTFGLLSLIIGLILVMTANYGMTCCEAGRRPPFNVILLIVAVAGMCFLASYASVRYKTEIIMYAALATTAIVFVCVLLACSKFDFTSYLLYVVVIALVFSAISLTVTLVLVITGTMMKPLQIALLGIGTLIQSVLLVMELQMILGGRAVEINENDYALAALMLYTSIVDIFIKMVHIIGLSSD